MTKADEMLEKLGYTKANDCKQYVFYEKDIRTEEEKEENPDDYFESDFAHLTFNYKEKTFEKTLGNDNTIEPIDMQELQAINEKVKELGWYEN